LNAPPQIFRFNGPVKSVTGPGPAGVTLLGNIAEPDASSTAAQLSLSCLESLQLPPVLNDVSVEALAAQEIVLRSGAREWRVRCTTWQLHRDVGATFYAAIPPRQMPWSRRVAWRVMLGFAALAPGRWLLARRARVK
jgi:hypothetical protein